MKDYKITDDDGEILVKTARQVATEFIKNNKKVNVDEKFHSRFSFESGVFVTLNNPDGLRGCVGYPMPQKKLFNALIDAAIAAATEDPRFSPVKPDELDNITFEVTVLTPPEEIHVSNTLEYPGKIRVGQDGLIVKYGLNSGLLLPQVAVEYGWNSEEFLSHTCEKAGLALDMWRDPQVKILKFEGIIFKETVPNGNIVRQKL